MKNYIQTGCGVLIINKGKILLGHRSVKIVDTGGIYEPDSWTLPGGKQEYKESITECAIREVKEETGLNIIQPEIFNVSDDIQNDKHFVTIHFIAKNYTGDLTIMEPDKIDDWKWFDIINLPDKIYSPSKKFIDEYLEINKF